MIYITGDIHREQDIHKINPREFTVGNSLTENDYVIICGDFGCVWDGSTGDNFWLKWLDSLPWNTLFRIISELGDINIFDDIRTI